METEIKLSLTRGEHARLKAAWGPAADVLEQESFFFDTAEGLLRKKRLALRFRREGARCFLTLKGAGKREGATYSRPECETEISLEQGRALRDGRPDWKAGPLAELERALGKRTALTVVGRIFNAREVFRVRGMEVLLDETSFPDGSRSCELECETEPASAPRAEQILREELARAGVGWKPSPMGKYARLLRILGVS